MDFHKIKALFYTTNTNECINHVMAWDMLGTSKHITFDHNGIRNDHVLLEAINWYNPDVIFYIGAASGRGIPKPYVFAEAKERAPIINLCSDAADGPWHDMLRLYKREKSFSLQVAIDGAFNSPADLVTLTPVNHHLFQGPNEKTIRFGFSGSTGTFCARSEIVNSLHWFGGLTLRKRSNQDGYREHIKFLKSCKIMLNTSFTGSGGGHHIKGRVIEAGLAKCCLLEHEDSPFTDWFPENCRIPYNNPKQITEIVNDIDDKTIYETASRLNQYIMEKYKASDIYGEMLNHVDIAK